MQKAKRIFALIGALLLAAMYVCTLIFALIGSEKAMVLFKASVACTIIVPVLLYGILLIARVLDNRENKENKHD